MTTCFKRRGYHFLSTFHKTNLQSLRSSSILSHRARERLPAKLYQKLTQYGQTEVKLVPKIEHASLYSKVINSGKPFLVNGNLLFKSSQHRLYQLLEAIVFHIMCVVECLKQDKDVPQLHGEFFNQVRNRFGELEGNVDWDKFNLKFNVKPNVELNLGLECFSLIAMQIKESYTVDDLVIWIDSCSSKSATSSVSLLSDNTPAFVLFDILLRSPRFKELFLVQLDLWTHNINYVMMQSRKDHGILKLMLDNLTYHAVMFEPNSLVVLYQTTLNFVKSPNAGLLTQLNGTFFDDLIWSLAVYSLRYQQIDPTGIANAQELLMSHIKNVGSSLSLRGYLGIAIVLSRISYDKGVQIFDVAQRKFARETSSKKNVLAFYIAKIYLAKSLKEAVDTFKTASNQFDHSSTLWLFFIRKLKYLNVMDEKWAKLLYQQISKSKVKITSDIIYELLHFVGEFDTLEDMFNALSSEKLVAVDNIFRVKYIQLIQHHKSEMGALPSLSWEFHDQAQSSHWNSIDECISHEYTTSPVKSLQLVVTYLSYISDIDATKFFTLYKKEVIDRDHLPNAACLGLLLRTARRSENIIVGENLFAPQLAIREFQRNVQASGRSFGIFPRDGLWKQYILLLAEFDYVSELSKIIKWWIDLDFKPKKSTILLLLNALPEEFALRHIKHHQVAKLRKDWDWPTTREFKKFKWLQNRSN